MRLREALNIQRGDVIAFTGAGGKTAALLALGRELAAEGWRVLATTTTPFAAAELAHIPGAVNIGGTGTTTVRPTTLGGLARASMRPQALSRALDQHQFVFVYTEITNDKVYGLMPDALETLIDSVDSDVLLIEADSARGKPFKAPYPQEPVIPPSASIVVPVVGIDAIGKPLDHDHIYNPEGMIAQYGYPYGERVKWPWVASVMRDTALGIKGVPASARVVALVNKVPPQGLARSLGRLVGRLMLREARIDAVALGAAQRETNPVVEVQRRIAAVVLAGGMSRRMNQPGMSKVLLPWDGRPIIRVIADRLKRLRLDDVVVVTGYLAAKVRGALTDEPVRIAHNADYKDGDMLSSLQTGLRALGPEIAACLVVLGDQPQIDNRVVAQIMTAYAEGRGKIIAPSYQNHRGHPILIDRSLWSEILDLPTGGALRDVINAHAEQTAYIVVESDGVLRDIDTPSDYQEERRRAGLG